MSESIPLSRAANGRLTGHQRVAITRILGRAHLSNVNKRKILHWLPSQAVVHSGTPIETALNAADAIKSIF